LSVLSVTPERAARIAALGYDYAAQPKQAVERCNLCGRDRFVALTHRDRYGYPAQAHACAGCGLVFLNPVMTAAAYGDFYQRTYRPLVSAFHGRLIDARTIQDEQRTYAAERAELLAPYLGGSGMQTLLDIGGSTGVVAHHLAERFGLQATVLDPAPLEVDEARKLGLETVTAMAEAYEPGDRRFDVVAMFQTIDHLLDVGGTLRRIRSLIANTGIFFVDIVDFRAAYLRNWSVEEAVKIDHPYYLTQETMEEYLGMVGFEVLRLDYAADHLHVSYVCRPGRPVSVPSRGVDELLREVRLVQNAPRP
jgi:2-polyprenyl-3-methyl-5-hydroxy-6-metoxy-1,4-benzoquinol methylase